MPNRREPLDPAVLAHETAVHARPKANTAQIAPPDETPVRPKRLLANDPANQPDGHDDYPTRIRG